MIECFQLPTAKSFTAVHYSLVNNAKTEVGTIENAVLFERTGIMAGQLSTGPVGTSRYCQLAESQLTQTPKKGDFIIINNTEYRIISDPFYQANPGFKPFYQCEIKSVK